MVSQEITDDGMCSLQEKCGNSLEAENRRYSAWGGPDPIAFRVAACSKAG